MILVSAICLGIGFAQAQVPQVSWAKLEDVKTGKWSSKAVYPKLNPTTELNRVFNREMKWTAESLFHESVFNRKVPPATIDEFSLKGILSVANDHLVSGLVSVSRTGKPTELVPVTCWLNGSQPVRASWGGLVAAGTSADGFARELLLPVVNDLRKLNSLEPLREFPTGLLDGFVVTQANVSWIVPPGVAGKNAEQIKVPHALVRKWVNLSGPLGHLWSESKQTVAFSLFVKWPIREDVPRGDFLQVSLFRDREATVALGVQKFAAKDPPMEVRCEFTGIVFEPDERLYVDVRVISGGTTTYRNREIARMPALGWQTLREMRLDRER